MYDGACLWRATGHVLESVLEVSIRTNSDEWKRPVVPRGENETQIGGWGAAERAAPFPKKTSDSFPQSHAWVLCGCLEERGSAARLSLSFCLLLLRERGLTRRDAKRVAARSRVVGGRTMVSLRRCGGWYASE